MTTSFSFVSYTGNGTTQTFNVPFQYISKSHVEVYIDGTLRTEGTSWDNDFTVRVAPAPPSGSVVRIERNTPKTTALVDFQDAGVLTESALDLNTRQALFIVQEAFDEVSNIIGAAVAAAQQGVVITSRSVPIVSPGDVGRVLVGRNGDTYGWMSGPEAPAVRSSLGLGSAALLNAGAAGSSLVQAATAADGRTALGLGSAAPLNAGTTGSSLIQAASAADGRTALGLGSAALLNAGTTGSSLIQAATAAEGRTALGAGAAGGGLFTASTGFAAFEIINSEEVTLASAATVDLGAVTSEKVELTGIAAIFSLGSAPAGRIRRIRFAGTATLVHNPPTLILFGSANIVAEIGDIAVFESSSPGVWRMVSYRRASGAPLLDRSVHLLPGSQEVISAASWDITGFPANARRIHLHLSTFIMSSVSPVIAQFGSSGGIQTTEYRANGTRIGASAVATVGRTDCAAIINWSATTDDARGVLSFIRMADDGRSWFAEGSGHLSSANAWFTSGSHLNLPAGFLLDRIRLTTVAGTQIITFARSRLSWEL